MPCFMNLVAADVKACCRHRGMTCRTLAPLTPVFVGRSIRLMEAALVALNSRARLARKVLVAICLFLACLFKLVADERISLAAKVNGQPVHLIFDTGASHTILFRPAAVRLGLKIVDPPPEAKVSPGNVKLSSAVCELTIGSQTQSRQIAVLDSAIPLGVDGLLAWHDYRTNIVQISGDSKEARFLDELPDYAAKWRHWKLQTVSKDDMSSRWLGLEIPPVKGKRRAVLVDTGADNGVSLSPARWKEWLRSNPGAPATLAAGYWPGLPEGLVVGEEYWARELPIAEGLRLDEVPIVRSPDSITRKDRVYEATLGLFALTRLSLIVDGGAGRVYVQTVPHAKTRYDYNRIGAVFTPRQISGGDLQARVIKDGPAYKAGIRDGDILMKVGDLDVTQWKTDPRILPLSRFWSQAAGTKVDLSCKRRGTMLNVTVELKEIFPAAVSSPRASSSFQDTW